MGGRVISDHTFNCQSRRQNNDILTHHDKLSTEVRVDPASFKESLIAAQMEVEHQELLALAHEAKAKEEAAEKKAIEILEFEKAAAVGKVRTPTPPGSSDI